MRKVYIANEPTMKEYLSTLDGCHWRSGQDASDVPVLINAPTVLAIDDDKKLIGITGYSVYDSDEEKTAFCADMTDARELLWDMLGDIPIDNDENIEEPFLGFEVGTYRQDIWTWFEEILRARIAYLMLGDGEIDIPDDNLEE